MEISYKIQDSEPSKLPYKKQGAGIIFKREDFQAIIEMGE